MASKRTHYKTCPTCGASLDVGERCDCEYVQEKADRYGLSVRKRYDRALGEEVFEIVNRAGSVVGGSNDIMMLSRYIDKLGNMINPVRRVTARRAVL